MAFCVQSSFEFDHVGILFGVYVIVGEVDCYIFDLELHLLREFALLFFDLIAVSVEICR